jgi:transposase InsO family protein
MAGLPEFLHVDNGADFRSRAFERACRDEGIKIIWRPPGEPHFGGHIERLIGTQMGPVHLLPGSTSSNVQDRREYDSKRHAALTLRELERYIGRSPGNIIRSPRTLRDRRSWFGKSMRPLGRRFGCQQDRMRIFDVGVLAISA